MPQLNANELAKALEQLFQFMEKKGVKIDDDKQAVICKEMVNALDHKLSPDDIKDPNVQKRLMSCITAKLAGDQKGFDNTLGDLKDDHARKEPDQKLDTKLTAMLLLLASLQKTKGEFDNKKELSPNPLKTILEITKKKDKDKEPTKEEKNEELELLKETLRNLYGGDDPTQAGEMVFPILGPIVGNAFGFTNQCAANPTSFAKLVDDITYNPAKTDPTGIENTAKLADMEDGIDMGPVFSPSYRR